MLIVTQYSKLWVVISIFAHVKKLEQASRRRKCREESKREHDELRRDYLRNKGYNIVEVWECKCWERVKEEENFRNHVRKNFPFKLPMKQESLLAKIRDGKKFGYVQCDLEVPDGLKYKFSNFPPILRTLMSVEPILEKI